MKVSIASLRAVHKHLSEILDRCDAQKRAESGKDDNLLDDPSGANDSARPSARPSARGADMGTAIPGFDRLSGGHLSKVRK
jgi:hypothetical protein